MSDQQKIWFIYLTDHHEGPFTPAEVGEKISQGLLNAQSLGWKDGMPEWLPLEQIPELSPFLASGSAAPLPAAEADAPQPSQDEEFSLAKLLADQQGGGAPEAQPLESSASNTSVLSSLARPAETQGASVGVTAEAVDSHAEIWTLKVGDQGRWPPKGGFPRTRSYGIPAGRISSR
jgi:hypothetical protein